MLVLFDNGTPRGLAAFLTGHAVEEARLHGWEELQTAISWRPRKRQVLKFW
jgi:hypothetical protein